MNALSPLLNMPVGETARIRRCGAATLARIACAAVAAGRSAVIVTRSRDEHAEALALATLLTPDLSADDIPLSRPLRDSPVIGIPAGLTLRRDRAVWAPRLAALHALALGRPRCVVLSIESLLVRQPPTNFFDGRILDIRRGADCPPELIADQLVEWGYVMTPMAEHPGEMARRGDIFDIFPPGQARPVRLEFFGDTVEEMRLFDVETQRSLAPAEEISILPALPFILDARGTRDIRRLLDERRSQGRLGENECYGAKKSLLGGGVGLLPGMTHAAPSLIEDWIPGDALWLLPDEADCGEELLNASMTLRDALEGDEDLPQPAALCLRDPAAGLPWRNAARVVAEPLVVGVVARGQELAERPIRSFEQLFPEPGAGDRPWQHLSAAFRRWRQEKRRVILSFSAARGRARFLKLAEQDGILPALRLAPDQPGLYALVSPFRDGADMAWDDALILGESILQPRAEKARRAPSRAFKGLDSFDDLNPGDLLAHRDYGIGRFLGLEHVESGDISNDFLLIGYSGDDRLYVPVDRMGLVRRYNAGGDEPEPALDKLGGSAWRTGRDKARRAIEKIAVDLVEMYAYRKVAKGFRYDPPDEMFHEFEATFGFEETPDQARAIQDVLDDMDRPVPMDRLVCGDVGFGKTEVALRAAFRAASEGRQAVLLCPTTILAEQHYQTFRSRLSGFPVTVGLLSRFVPKNRQKEVLAAAAEGKIDILLGTHRLLSADVKLPNLALLILDEEQRFGVRHKEKLKALRRNVDVLTLTATPIPRTLQLSMAGIRDLSVIETAPQERRPVATAIIHRDPEILRGAIRREMERGGQVFWVYNRVQGLERVRDYVLSLAPDARVGMAHGQMGEADLEKAMRDFWHGGLDVLVCTSIVESGLDFPRANTLVVDQAQMFGLGQLYQLRGRVGRSDRQAYAYLVAPDEEHISEKADERLRVLQDLDYLGAGFQAAMEDLRLRGAGNILGEVQSGHMHRVGLDFYLEMLEEAVARLKGTPVATVAETEINLGVPAHIPQDWITDARERLRCYKSLTSAVGGAAREEVALSMRDRFGALPEEMKNFLAMLDFKQFLTELQVRRADISRDHLRLTWPDRQTAADPGRILALAASTPGARLLPPAGLHLPLTTPSADDGGFPAALNAARALLERVRATPGETNDGSQS